MSDKMYKILSVFVIWLFSESNEFVNTKDRPADVGELCIWEGVIGNCINYWTCVTNAIDSLHGKYPPVCSFDGNEMKSCCTSCKIVANISTTVLIEGSSYEKNDKKSHDKCLDYLKLNGKLYDCYGKAYGVGKVSKYYTEEGQCFRTGAKGSLGAGGEDAGRAEYPHMRCFQCSSYILTFSDCLDYKKQYGKFYECYFAAYGVGDFVKINRKEDHCTSYGSKGSHGVGGKDARRAEYPHMALLGYGEDQELAQWQCGGSIISEWYVLTAGHCRSNQVGAVQFIALGILKRSDPPSLWQVYRVDTFIPHPEYRPPSKYHDIALIRTDKRIEFSNAVLPACLPQGDETEEDMKTAYATGWGTLGYRRRLADVLQKVKVNRFTSEQCSKQYGRHRHLRHGFHNTTQMCYGDSDLGRDTCEGDSGGPLQIDEPSICPQIVIGVTSSGHPCGFAGTAGLYTRVAYYQPWIEGIVWP